MPLNDFIHSSVCASMKIDFFSFRIRVCVRTELCVMLERVEERRKGDLCKRGKGERGETYNSFWLMLMLTSLHAFMYSNVMWISVNVFPVFSQITVRKRYVIHQWIMSYIHTYRSKIEDFLRLQFVRALLYTHRGRISEKERESIIIGQCSNNSMWWTNGSEREEIILCKSDVDMRYPVVFSVCNNSAHTHSVSSWAIANATACINSLSLQSDTFSYSKSMKR